MALFIVLCILFPILTSAILISSRQGIFSPFVWFSLHMLLYYVVAPADAFILFGRPLNIMSVFSTSLTVVLVIFFYFGLKRQRFFFDIAQWTRNLSLRIELDERKVRRRVIRGFALGISIYLLSVYVIYNGSLTEVFSNPLQFRLEMGKGVKTIFYLLQYHLLYTFFFIYIAYRVKLGKKPFSLFVILYASLLTILAFSYGSRGILLSFPLQMLIILEMFGKRPSIAKIFIVAIPVVLLFAGYLTYRNTGLSDQNLTISTRLQSAFSFNSETFEQVANSIVQRADALENLNEYFKALQSGRISSEPLSSFFKAPLQLIPRDVFPDKPLYFSSDMTKQLLPEVFQAGVTYDFTGIAEWIHNFGFGLLPLFALFPAFVLCIAQRCYVEGDPFVAYAIIYISIGNLPIAIINNGFLNTSNIVWLPLTFFICLWMMRQFFKPKLQRKEANSPEANEPQLEYRSDNILVSSP